MLNFFKVTLTNHSSVNCVLALPEVYSDHGAPIPVVMFCHGYGGYVSESTWSGKTADSDSDLITLIKTFTTNGYAVFDVDNTKSAVKGWTDVGNPQLMESYLKAYSYIKANYNVQEELFLYSLSFGTYPAMNLMKWYPSKVKAAIMAAPRASLKSVFDRGGEHPTRIAEGFGFDDKTGAVYEADKMLGYDTYADIITLNNTDYLFKQFPPIKVFMSTADKTNFDVALRMVHAIKNSGNVVDLRIVDGLNHHEMCYCTQEALLLEVINWFYSYR